MTDTQTTPKVLVAYGSKHGATAEIAAAVADELTRRGLVADLVEAGAAGDVTAYDAVVLGSAVYMRHWQPSARRLLRRLERRLGRRPLWIFSSGPIGEAEPDPEWCEPARVIDRAWRLNLQDHVVFGGRVPLDPGNFVERAMLRDTPAESQDRRDFDEIRGWADQIATTLARDAVAV